MVTQKSYLPVISLALVLIFVVSLFLSGCSSPTTTATAPKTSAAPAPATSAAPAPATSAAPPPVTSAAPASKPAASSPAAGAPTFELKFLDQFAPGTAAANQSELLGKTIMDATGGKIKITYFHAESLGKASDFVTLLNGGVTDIVNLTPGAYPTVFDVESYVNLPMIGINSRAAGIDVVWSLYNKGFLTGLKDYKPLAFNPTPPMNFWLKKKVNTVADFKGLKIRGGDAPARQFIDLLGGVGTSMLSSEVYMAIDRGTLDGLLTADEQVFGTKLFEVEKYGLYNPKTSIGVAYFLMTKATWNKFPKDIQDAIDKAIETHKAAFLDSVKADDAAWADRLKEKGMEIYGLNADETAKMFKVAEPIKTDWITQRAAKGVPAKDLAALVDTVLAKYK
jgi:TRAP-type transport system periplasmic protein